MRSTMLFAHVIALSIGSVLAAPSVNLLKRDLQTIQTSIGNVQTALGGLDTAVKVRCAPVTRLFDDPWRKANS